MKKIASELTALREDPSDISTSMDQEFVELNRELIAQRFANKVARADVVQELLELKKAARMILAA